MPRDLIPPWGCTLLHGEAGKPTTAVGVALPQGCALVGRAGCPSAAGGGNGRAADLAGGVSAAAGLFRAAGGARAGASGAKSRTRGRFRASGGVPRRASGRAAGAFSGPSRGFFRGAPGKNRAAPGQNGAFGRPSGAGTAGVGGKKAPFCREKGGQRGCAGAKTGGESWRGVKGYLPRYHLLRAVSAEKLVASKKPFRAHIGRNCLSPLFFVDGAPSLGRIIWWIGRVAIWGEKSDECVTPRGTPHGKRKRRQPHENTDFRHRD